MLAVLPVFTFGERIEIGPSFKTNFDEEFLETNQQYIDNNDIEIIDGLGL